MPHGDVIDVPSALVDSVQAGRAARTRVVESAVTERLDCPEAVIAASAARRCVAESRKTLASLYGERL